MPVKLAIDTPLVIERPASRAAADAFADAVGEDRAKVRVLDPKWKDLLKAGAKVDVHCTRWRAVTTLTLEDLGIEPANDEVRRAWESLLSLGNRYLLPKRIVDGAQQLENKFRNALWRRAFKTHWGYFLPEQRYAEWKAEAETIRKEYVAYAEAIYLSWDALVHEVWLEYRALASENYDRLVAAGQAPAEGRSQWVVDFVTRAMRRMEGREYVRDSFSMSWEVSYIPLASMLADDEAQAVHIAAVAQAKTEMEKDILRGAAQLFDDGLHQFVADVRSELTERVFNVCCDVLGALEKNDGELPRNSSKQLKNLVDAVDGLKFWDDKQLDAQMETIRQMMATRYDKRDGVAVKAAMRQIGAEARLLLTELDRTPERHSRTLGIPESPGGLATFVRQARAFDAGTFELPAEPVRRQRRRLEVTE